MAGKSRTGRRKAERDKDALRGELQLLKCAKRLEQLSTSRFRDLHGSSLARFDVLANLDMTSGGPVSTSELAKRLIASKGNITRLLDRMEADGLIIRRPNAEDRRISDVYLSESGTRSFQKMAADHARWMSDIFGVLVENETEQLVQLLGRIRERIDERIDEHGKG